MYHMSLTSVNEPPRVPGAAIRRGGTIAGALILLVLALLIPQASAVSQPHAATASAERELFRLENEWARAVVKRDAATLHRMTAPDWVYSDESGVMEREAGIKSFTTGTDTVRDASNEKMHAIIHDNAAVVIGVLVMKGSGAHGPFTNRYRYTDAWAKLDGRWQCIGSQDYLLPARKR